MQFATPCQIDGKFHIMTKEKDTDDETDEESELEEEIEELEEEIQDEDEIFDEDIIEFIPSVKSRNSTLEKINSSIEILNLEENLKATTHLPDIEEDESFKYGNSKDSDEPKYQNFDGDYSSSPITSFEKMKDERDKMREVKFFESEEARISPEKNFERYENVKRFDVEDFRKNDSRKEIKYKPSA